MKISAVRKVLQGRQQKKDYKQRRNSLSIPVLNKYAIPLKEMATLILSNVLVQRFLPMHADHVLVCGTDSVQRNRKKIPSCILTTGTLQKGMMAIQIPMHLLAHLNW